MAHTEARPLRDIATELGECIPRAGNRPLDLGDAQFSWFIEAGAVDLLVVESRDGVEQTAPQHVLRAESGRLLPPVETQRGDTVLGLIAKGRPGTVLRCLPVASLSLVGKAELAEQIDAWIAGVSAFLARGSKDTPHPDVLVETGSVLAAQAGTLSARRGVAWVSDLPPGSGSFMGLIDLGAGSGSSPLPLTPSIWISLADEASVSVESSEELAEQGLLLSALASFHAVGFALERLNRSLATVDQANLDFARAITRRFDEESARQRLFNLYDLPLAETFAEADASLKEALRIVGRSQGIDFKWPERDTPAADDASLAEVLISSGVRTRRVRINAANRWWVDEGGPMLAFRAADGRPVALLPGRFRSYRLIDPVERSATKVSSKVAESLHPDAWVFYTPLPPVGIDLKKLLGVVRPGLFRDIARFVGVGLAGGLVALLPAIALGLVADRLILYGQTDLLFPVAVALAGFAASGALLHVLRGMSWMRIHGRVTSKLEAALWDRMLRLPPGFLRRHVVGDIAMRGMAFQGLRDVAHGMAGNAVLSVGFLLPALLVACFYDTVLGIVTIAFGLLSLAVAVALGMRQIAPQGLVMRSAHRLSGQLYQLLNGIAQLRVGRAEGSAFAAWARRYREKKQAELRVGAIEEHLRAFGEALPFATGAVLFLAAALADRETLSVGAFLVVYALLMLFQSAVIDLCAAFSTLAATVPTLRQVQPLLAETPEQDVAGATVAELQGAVTFDHVSFQYDSDGPLILDDVSIHAEPGEFVAIAGESGAGKSTLLKLALGLNSPTSGAIYYDQRDLAHLNLKQLRRKIGVVPQDIHLYPQDVFDNIVAGSQEVTHDEAWEAARLASVDRTIAAMPMGMMTSVGTGFAAISGGESQRIVIAQALVDQPRVLFLDEATNWLDNEHQAAVMDNLAGQRATRIVIAHRLSTLRHADRIYVMKAGRVVQVGSFVELASAEGAFQDVVRRQSA
ncbi:MAG: ATP-binding cassette domain-containing protein [Bryobacterales bacterium]|nr:ATP-binding cassette domain-containing protein [Bryobacterales bacterium]